MTTTEATERDEEIRQIVRERYAEIARRGGGCGPGCCGSGPEEVAGDIGYSETDVAAVPAGANLGLGCGVPLAAAALRPGETVLDLGSGAGFDAFLAAREVGESGRVIGVDMTPEMLERARRNAEAGGYRNVEFRAGRIESLPVEDNGVDVVISNCVINLVPDKAAAYREVARVLRPGGRLVISDVVLDAALPQAIAQSVLLLTGCVAGASMRDDYLRTIAAAGLVDIEVVSDRSFGDVAIATLPDELLSQAREAGIDLPRVAQTVRSLTIRARKLAKCR